MQKIALEELARYLVFLGFRFLLGGYTHHMPNGIKNFQVNNVFKCETKNFNDSYDK
jgi:hypothetical protein